MYLNTRTRLSGHVWQGRFYSTPMDDPHLWAAIRYVEQNAVRAGLVQRPEDYPWSSAGAHWGLRPDALLSAGFPEPGIIEDWQAWLSEAEDEEAIAHIQQQTHTGRPCGSPQFLTELENMLQRVLRPRKRGRKPKAHGAHGSMRGKGVIRSLSGIALTFAFLVSTSVWALLE